MSLLLRKLPVLTAGLAYAVDGLIQLRHTQPDQHWTGTDRLIEAFFALALLASVAAVPTVRDLIGASRSSTAGARVSQVGFTGVAVASVTSLIHGGNVLGPLFAVGLLVTLIGLIVLAVAGARHGAMKWPAPVLLASFLAGMVLGDHGGTVLIGAGWLVIAWLVVDPAISSTQPTPVYQ